ncbi:hypothetical protein KCU65_g413, partial [Aureobasidium melanogenum]
MDGTAGGSSVFVSLAFGFSSLNCSRSSSPSSSSSSSPILKELRLSAAADVESSDSFSVFVVTSADGVVVGD